MKGIVAYRVFCDGLEIDDFEAPANLTQCQLERVAYEFAKEHGITGFGANGIKIKQVRSEGGY